jgi:hypothetical protein
VHTAITALPDRKQIVLEELTAVEGATGLNTHGLYVEPGGNDFY